MISNKTSGRLCDHFSFLIWFGGSFYQTIWKTINYVELEWVFIYHCQTVCCWINTLSPLAGLLKVLWAEQYLSQTIPVWGKDLKAKHFKQIKDELGVNGEKCVQTKVEFSRVWCKQFCNLAYQSVCRIATFDPWLAAICFSWNMNAWQTGPSDESSLVDLLVWRWKLDCYLQAARIIFYPIFG